MTAQSVRRHQQHHYRGVRLVVAMTTLTVVLLGGLAFGRIRHQDSAPTATRPAPVPTTAPLAQPAEMPVSDQEAYQQWQIRQAPQATSERDQGGMAEWYENQAAAPEPPATSGAGVCYHDPKQTDC